MGKLLIDYIGSFEKSKLNERINVKKFCILVITEVFTKFTKIYLIKNLNPKSFIIKIKKYFTEFGTPKSMISDQS
jgi:hypothetical protein